MGKKNHSQQNGKAKGGVEMSNGTTRKGLGASGKGAKKKQNGKVAATRLQNGKAVLQHVPNGKLNNNNSKLNNHHLNGNNNSTEIGNGHTTTSPLSSSHHTNGRIANGKSRSNGRNGGPNGCVRTSRTSRSCANSSTDSMLLNRVSWLTGVLIAVYVGYNYAVYLQTLNENRLWFSNIKEVEREISFRTESGLYYSYYKQLVQAPSISQGFLDLTQDNVTENWRTINVLQRFNIYQEVVLGVLYRTLPYVQDYLKPIFFYIDAIFALHGLYIVALYCTAWMLSGSWLAGVLAAVFFIFNKVDTTRAEFTIPLRESFGYPFLYLQMSLITYYLRPVVSHRKQLVTLGCILLSSFSFVLTWQFAQFIFLLQAVALYGSTALNVVPSDKVIRLLIVQGLSLLMACALQFFNEMIIGSLVLSFIIAAVIDLTLQGLRRNLPCSIVVRLGRLILHIMFTLGLAVFLNSIIKYSINLDADQHIFKFLLSKFQLGNTRDFDAMLYKCNGAFGFLPVDTFTRLSTTMVFPIYVVTLLVSLVVLAIAVFQNWRYYALQEKAKKDDNIHLTSVDEGNIHMFSRRPELVYHVIQTVFFASMALCVLRFKFLWTPHMCVLAAVGVTDYHAWETILSKFGIKSEITVQCIRHIASILVFCVLLSIALPGVTAALESLMEFYDPDTVELMNWINEQTSKTAVFSGSMQLLAGVKLCTGRRLTNHPHYEDKLLREVTQQVYQYYGRTSPEEVYNIHKALGTDYLILENSICYSRGEAGCRLPDLIDISNGMLYDGATESSEPGLKPSSTPRFCDAIQRGGPEYAKYFKSKFTNPTFRIYQVLS